MNGDSGSTYVQNPPYFERHDDGAGALLRYPRRAVAGVAGDSITTDHISPAGSIQQDGPAGDYLMEHQVRPVTSTPTARGAAIIRS